MDTAGSSSVAAVYPKSIPIHEDFGQRQSSYDDDDDDDYDDSEDEPTPPGESML